MACHPCNSSRSCYSCFKVLRKSSDILTSEPSNAYLQKKKCFFSGSRYFVGRNNTSASHPIPLSLTRNSFQLVKDGIFWRKFSFATNESGNQGFRNENKMLVKTYDDLMGFTKMRKVQSSLKENEQLYREAKERKEEKHRQLDELNIKLRKPRPPKYATNEARTHDLQIRRQAFYH